MDLTFNIIINIYSIALLIIICYNSLKHDERESLQHKLYMMVLKITILMLVVDIFSRFDGKPDTIYPVINHFGNFMIFLLNSILPSLWLLYVHVQVFQDEKETKLMVHPLLAINALNAVMVVLTQFFRWFYYIDPDNIYHRGPFFLFSALIPVALIFVAFVLIIANRKKIEKKHYFSLMFFAVPPFVCIILQILFYGISLMLNSVVLSLLMVSLNIQNHGMYTDYLTGVNNRKKLEIYLNEKISTSTEDKTFSAIMIDLNSFKSINDTFGHDMGDNALQVFAKLLNNCLRSNDFIARFGGDEFIIVLDIYNRIDLEEIVRRINVCVEKYNESGERPYKLDFSIGYAVYDYHSHMKAEEFQKQIDILMYENKQANKEIRRNYS
jgi:diguanylate cyclase (GGDEF)-like protein